MFDQTGEFLELFETGLESRFGEFSQRKFVFVVADLFEDCVEVVLARFELAGSE